MESGFGTVETYLRDVFVTVKTEIEFRVDLLLR